MATFITETEITISGNLKSADLRHRLKKIIIKNNKTNGLHFKTRPSNKGITKKFLAYKCRCRLPHMLKSLVMCKSGRCHKTRKISDWCWPSSRANWAVNRPIIIHCLNDTHRFKSAFICILCLSSDVKALKNVKWHLKARPNHDFHLHFYRALIVWNPQTLKVKCCSRIFFSISR